MEKVKCLVVKPRKDYSLKEVRSCLDFHRISYSHWDEENTIFANLAEIPEDLREVADVVDAVFQREDRWFFQIPGDDLSKPHDDEDQARCRFVIYISWAGEFVNNAIDSRNDA